jgi:hypothetical protein
LALAQGRTPGLAARADVARQHPIPAAGNGFGEGWKWLPALRLAPGAAFLRVKRLVPRSGIGEQRLDLLDRRQAARRAYTNVALKKNATVVLSRKPNEINAIYGTGSCRWH